MITSEKTDLKQTNINDPVLRNGLDEEVIKYKETAIRSLKFSIIYKPAIISLVALIFSFFLDLSYVPIFGNISVQLGQALFPNWQPAAEDVVPYSFWWLPVVVYSFFILMAYLAYNKLKTEITRSPATETIDRIITSYNSVIDGIATALPLIGAALLLISIKLGEEIFLGLSVPFEIKALIILALGKLFEPVLDQLGVEFQNIVNHIKEIKEKYHSRLQIDNSRNLLKQVNTQSVYPKLPDLSESDMQTYRDLMDETSRYSEVLVQNFTSVYAVLDKIRSIEALTSDKITELNKLAENLSTATKHLGNENTITGLKHLENIVLRK
jgi:hypothetical protein